MVRSSCQIFFFVLIPDFLSSIDTTGNLFETYQYEKERSLLIKQNDEISFSSSIELSDEETRVNDIFSEARDRFIITSSHDNTANMFFHDWPSTYLSSEIYNMISTMPKGGALHLHSGSSGSVDWIVEIGIEMDDCFIYWGVDDPSRCLNPTTGSEQNCPGLPLLKGTLGFFPNGEPPPGFQKPNGDIKKELRSYLTSNSSLKDMDRYVVRSCLIFS